MNDSSSIVLDLQIENYQLKDRVEQLTQRVRDLEYDLARLTRLHNKDRK